MQENKNTWKIMINNLILKKKMEKKINLEKEVVIIRTNRYFVVCVCVCVCVSLRHEMSVDFRLIFALKNF